MALTRIEQVDLTIFEYIRMAVVNAGYLPDITNYTSAGDYTAAKNALRNTIPEKQLIEVFGVGAAESRDAKTVCKIVIERIGFTKGGLGGFPATKFVRTGSGSGSTFEKFVYPAASKTVRYEVRYIANLTKFDRIIMQLIEDTFGDRCYVKTVNVSGQTVTLDGQEILIDQTNYIDVSSTDLIEKMYTFQVPDVWIAEFKKIGTNIPPMTTVHYQVYPNTFDSTGTHEDFDIPNVINEPADFNEDFDEDFSTK